MAEHDFTITIKPPKGDDGYRTFSIRIKESTVTKLENLARQTGRTRNELIGLLLEMAVDKSTIG